MEVFKATVTEQLSDATCFGGALRELGNFTL